MAVDTPEVVEEDAPKKKRGKKKILIPVLVLLLGLGGGGYAMSSGKSKAAAKGGPTTTTTIVLGKVIPLQAITLNLSDGHVLKVGMALQLVEKPKDKQIAAAIAGGEGAKVDPTSPLQGQEAKALDEAILELGNMTYEQLSAPDGRAAAKAKLSTQISEIYKGDITQVYFTAFVMS